eukprot:CAMPEP_0180486298 /NCGR_PEP_ID=MMETSP1036_2-20121128/36924_1 /TAXON_ID=632150 /ORGANISM="Azadinium spinosum, Strain 3D9" /LENGTH=401 /DNA_ID=CAMNT_0022494249 /DNA_START=192 /DNA_END=1397 /DNA_ORIENTATION=-
MVCTIIGIVVHIIISGDIIGALLSGDRMYMWNKAFQKCGIAVTRNTYVLVLSLLLPAIVLFMYSGIGQPVWTEGQLNGYDIDALLADGNWPQAGGLSVDTVSWIVTGTGVGDNLQVSIWSHECYKPHSAEFRLLEKLRGFDERPKQSYCVSALGQIVTTVWGWDDDFWEEVFEFSMRVFAALAGFIANSAIEADSGGFMEDLSDIYDMYMFTFVDKEQLIAGRVTLREAGSRSLHTLIETFLYLSYFSMILRVYLCLAWKSQNDPMSYLARKTSSGLDKENFRNIIDSSLSLLFVEIPFLTIRLYALYKFRIPVSILAVKNIFELFRDTRTVFRRGKQEKQDVEDDETDIIDAADDTRIPCRYGDKCYNRRKGHRLRYSHPVLGLTEDGPAGSGKDPKSHS